MSLSYEQFNAACEAEEKLNKRLKGLLGSNPAITDHYGRASLYNEEINLKTTDEEILKIHAAFIEWKKAIVAVFAENGVLCRAEDLDRMFDFDGMFGIMRFLGITVDIYGGVDKYIPAIKGYISRKNA